MGAAQDFGATINSYLPSWNTVNNVASRSINAPDAPMALPKLIVNTGGDFLSGLFTGQNSTQAAQAAAAAQPKAATPAAAAPGKGTDPSAQKKAFADALSSGIAQSLGLDNKSGTTAPTVPTFAEMAGQLQKAQGGKISLNQMAQLARIGQEAYIRPAQLRMHDVAIGQYMQAENQQFDAAQKAAQAALANAKTDSDKQAAVAMGQKAVAEHLAALKDVASSGNPMNDVLAQMIANGGGGQ